MARTVRHHMYLALLAPKSDYRSCCMILIRSCCLNIQERQGLTACLPFSTVT
jgi:hypothetical protein